MQTQMGKALVGRGRTHVGEGGGGGGGGRQSVVLGGGFLFSLENARVSAPGGTNFGLGGGVLGGL